MIIIVDYTLPVGRINLDLDQIIPSLGYLEYGKKATLATSPQLPRPSSELGDPSAFVGDATVL
jgi:hypothetical protein